jgi:hypothetical protein
MIVYQCPDCYHTMPKFRFEFSWGLHPYQQHRKAECRHRRARYERYREIDLEHASTATVFTVGYAGRSLDEFLALVQIHQIALVMDTRWLPLARFKPDFSKNRLRAALQAAIPGGPGVGYWHCKPLGSPPVLREALARTNDYVAFFAAYRAHLVKQKQVLLDVQALVVDQQRVALLCSEAHVEVCHRSVLAQEIQALLGGKSAIVHL